MKKLVVNIVGALSAIATSVAVFGQAQIGFQNYGGGVNAPILGVDGQPLPASVDKYKIELWAGTTIDSLAPIASTTKILQLGYFIEGMVTTPWPGGTHIFAQLRAWDLATGNTWANALIRGESNIIEVDLTSPPALPPMLIGLQSFQLYVIPEPSTIALGLLGVAALMLRRRMR